MNYLKKNLFMSFFLENFIINSNNDSTFCDNLIIQIRILNSKKYLILKFRLIYDWNNAFYFFQSNYFLFHFKIN